METGLRLRAGTGSFPLSPSHSIENFLEMTYFVVGRGGKQAQIT